MFENGLVILFVHELFYKATPMLAIVHFALNALGVIEQSG